MSESCIKSGLLSVEPTTAVWAVGERVYFQYPVATETGDARKHIKDLSQMHTKRSDL